MENEEGHDEYSELLRLNTMPSAEFQDLYGFEHNCRCAQDWIDGNTGLVSECYTKLCDDALTRCHEFKGQLAEAERTLVNLRLQVAELGGEPRG